MGITNIKWFVNEALTPVSLDNVENGRSWHLDAEKNSEINQWIPWCTSQHDFDNNHYIVINTDTKKYWIWQSNEGSNDLVRYNTEERWKPRAPQVEGYAKVNGDRTLYVRRNKAIVFAKFPP